MLFVQIVDYQVFKLNLKIKNDVKIYELYWYLSFYLSQFQMMQKFIHIGINRNSTKPVQLQF